MKTFFLSTILLYSCGSQTKITKMSGDRTFYYVKDETPVRCGNMTMGFPDYNAYWISAIEISRKEYFFQEVCNDAVLPLEAKDILYLDDNTLSYKGIVYRADIEIKQSEEIK